MKQSPEVLIERARRMLAMERPLGVCCLLVSALGLAVLFWRVHEMMIGTLAAAQTAWSADPSGGAPSGAFDWLNRDMFRMMLRMLFLTGVVLGGGLSGGVLLFGLGLQFLVGNAERRLLVEMADRVKTEAAGRETASKPECSA